MVGAAGVLLISLAARAEPDAASMTAPPDGDELLDARWSWVVAPEEASVGLNLAYAASPMVRRVTDGEVVDEQEILGDLVALDVGAVYAPSRRVAFAVQAPLFLAAGGLEGPAGPALGDVHLWVPVALASSEAASLSVLPSVGLPTGRAANHLGAGTPTAELALSGTIGGPVLRTWGTAGVRYEPDGALEGPVPRATGSAGIGVSPASWLGLLAEGRVTATLPSGAAVRQVPGEVRLGARGAVTGHLSWQAGVSRAVSSGIGASALRVDGGVVVRLGPDPIVEEVPVILPIQRIIARDGAGRPVRGALVRVDDREVGTTDAEGSVTLEKPARLDSVVTVSRQDLGTSTVTVTDGVANAVLGWRDVPFELRITGTDGRLLPEATVTFEGLTNQPVAAVDDVGTRTYALPVGDYTVTISAPGLGTQTRTVAVAAGRTERISIDAILAPALGPEQLALALQTPDGHPIEGAFVAMDGTAYGSTSSGGSLVISGLATGSRRLVVSHESHVLTTATLASPDERVVLDWKPGTVVVSVRGSGGPIPDAIAAFDGPARLAPVQLGPGGERAFQLRDGPWVTLVSSPALGSQQRRFEVRSDGSAQRVDIVLAPDEDGDSSLLLDVRDLDGVPVEGARLALDDVDLGTTTNLGALEALDLDAGPRHFALHADGLEPLERDVTLVPGPNRAEARLRWLPGTVQVLVRDERGEPVNATIAWTGPSIVPAAATGDDGALTVRVEPGTWRMLVSSPDYGAQTRTLVIPADTGQRLVVDARLNPPDADDATLAFEVLDSLGLPVPNAVVALDGEPLGETGTHGDLTVGGLGAGRHTISVTADGLAAATTKATARSAATVTVPLAMEWAPGAVQANVVDPTGAAVKGALVAASGAFVLPPVQTDASGHRRLALAPGDWWLLASAPSFAPTQQRIRVPAEAGLADVKIALRAADPERAQVVVRLYDPSGEPVPNVAVKVNGEDVGLTTPDGALVLPDLEPGAVALVLTPPPAWQTLERRVELAGGPGEETFVLQWRKFDVNLRVASADKVPLDAQLLLSGPEAFPTVRTGEDGAELVSLRVGSWQAFASRPDLGVGRASFEVKPDTVQAVDVVINKPRAAVTVSDNQVRIEEQIRFDVDRATLKPEALPILAEVATVLLAHPELGRIEIQGHTDDVGELSHNLDLSQRRAEAVRAEFIRLGVPQERLVARGYGMLRPLVAGTDEASRAQNRRVQFVVARR